MVSWSIIAFTELNQKTKSLKKIVLQLSKLNNILSLLKIDGEIHIIDTPFYTNEEILSAKFRSEKYFNKYNSAMKDKYFHHQLNNLSEFKTKIIFNPKSPINRIKRSLFDDITPFLHIAIMR